MDISYRPNGPRPARSFLVSMEIAGAQNFLYSRPVMGIKLSLSPARDISALIYPPEGKVPPEKGKQYI